jgi:exodeoxyribonuclease-5
MADDGHSPQQVAALKMVEDWFTSENALPVFRLFGYAGTGKTTLALTIARKIRAMVKEADGDAKGAVVFAAFTGKAASVLRSKGCYGARTIHSLIYSLDEGSSGGDTPTFSLNPASDLTNAKLCVIDECSMVDDKLGKDLLSFGVKVLVLGDPAQLPPVGNGTGFFTEHKPDVMLTEVHRQAEGNPIIRLSMDIRAGARLDFGDYGACKVVPWKTSGSGLTTQDILAADQLLCGKNVTREGMNARYRVLANFKAKLPMQGDKLVCLRNDKRLSLFNGGLWKVVKGSKKLKGGAIPMVVEPDDAEESARAVKIKVHPIFFEGDPKTVPWEERKGTQEFTYGYVLTVHKAQGSQWKNVILFNEAGEFGQHASRWLYTGVTRAAEKLTVVMR